MQKSKTFPASGQIFFYTLWKLSYDALNLPSIVSIGMSIRFIGTDGSSHTLGPLLEPNMMQLVLLSSGREDEFFVVEFETNMSLAVDPVRLWPGFQARRVVIDGEK